MPDLPPGHDLDRQIAERVFGELMPTQDAMAELIDNTFVPWGKSAWYILCDVDRGIEPQWVPMPFSTDDGLSMRVVRKMAERGYVCKIGIMPPDLGWAWVLFYRRTLGAPSKSDDIPHAICLAALAALEREG